MIKLSSPNFTSLRTKNGKEEDEEQQLNDYLIEKNEDDLAQF